MGAAADLFSRTGEASHFIAVERFPDRRVGATRSRSGSRGGSCFLSSTPVTCMGTRLLLGFFLLVGLGGGIHLAQRDDSAPLRTADLAERIARSLDLDSVRCRLVVVIDPDCPACQRMVRRYGEESAQTDVVWIVAGGPLQASQFAIDYDIPLHQIMPTSEAREASAARELSRIGVAAVPLRAAIGSDGSIGGIRVTDRLEAGPPCARE